jgi:ubiquitin carboxyl-terminal hydrolase 22/27/51
MYGCGKQRPFSDLGSLLTAAEHLQRLFNQDQATTNTSIQHYRAILRSIFDTNPLIPQTAKAIDGQIVTSLTPTYLCLQCPSTLTEDDRTKHGTKKSHRFCMSASPMVGGDNRVSTAH